MIIYNVTVKVDHSIADDWLSWLQQEHIPEIIATECFTDARNFEAKDEHRIVGAQGAGA